MALHTVVTITVTFIVKVRSDANFRSGLKSRPDRKLASERTFIMKVHYSMFHYDFSGQCTYLYFPIVPPKPAANHNILPTPETVV